MTIVRLSISWLLGIWLAAHVHLDLATWIAGFVGGSLAAIFWRRRERLRLHAALLAVLFAGGARHALAIPQIDARHVATYNGAEDVLVRGLVVAEPELRERSLDLLLRVERLTPVDAPPQPVRGLLLVRAPRFPVFEYGTRLQVTGRLETPELGDTFDYRNYLARKGIHSVMAWPHVEVLAVNVGHPFYHLIFSLKARAKATIDRLIAEPQASLLNGILLGDDSGLSPSLVEAFRATGMTHIIAISGFNIALLAGILLRGSRPWLGHRASAWATLLGLVLYTILVGADASVVRAAIMGSLYVIATRLLGRPTFAPAGLFTAALFMTLVDPFALWDVGFQLSFVATLGLMLYARPFGQWAQTQLGRFLRQEKAERLVGLFSETVIVTLAAQVLTLPLIVFHFEQLSLASLPANLLVLPAQPSVMIWGGLATLVGMVLPAVGQLLAWVAWLFLAYTIVLVRLLAQLPLASVPLSLGPAGLVAVYAAIFGATWILRQHRERRSRTLGQLRQSVKPGSVLLFSVVLLFLAWFWARTRPDGKLHVSFLDVGQGDAIFVQTPSGRQILVDGGHYPTVLNDQLGRQMSFWDRQLDVVVATHPDADHVSGLPGVFDRYRVDLLVTNGAERGAAAVYDAVLDAAARDRVAVRQAMAGEVMAVDDGVRLEILHPGPRPLDNDNDRSVAVRLVYGDFTLFLTGDAEAAAERAMLATGSPVQALVFKAGHHGARTSSNDFFLDAVQPQIVVISAGAGNRYGHPHEEVLQRAAAVGAAVLRTDELGTIEVVTDGEQMWWETH